MDVKPVIKQYWPYMLGGGIALYFILRGSGSSGGAVVDNSGYYAAAAAQQGQSQQYQLQQQALAGQQAISMEQVSLAGQAAYMQQLGATADAIGTAASRIIESQSMIPISTINAANAANIATMQESAKVAVSGINASGMMTSAAAIAVGQNAAIVQSAGQAYQSQTSTLETVANVVGTVASAYGTGGSSLVLSGVGSNMGLGAPR